MQRHEAALARLAAEQIGLATTEQALDLMSEDELRSLMDAGVLVRAHRGVLRHAATPLTDRSRLLAAAMACGPLAVASHRSAAVLHGFDLRRSRPEITVTGTGRPVSTDAVVHRTKLLDPCDRTRIGPIPCTTAGRTAFDLGSVLPWQLYEHILQVAQIEKRLDVLDLVAVLDRVGCRGRGGTAKLRAYLRDSVPDARLASWLEHLVLAIVARLDVEPPELQYELVCIDGRVVVLDMAWPRWKLAIEANGHRWHATRKQLDHDEARRRSIRATGWHHDAYTWSDAHEHTARTETEILRTLSTFRA